MLALTFAEAARIIAFTHTICKIPLAGEDLNTEHDNVHIYQETGPKAGLYVDDHDIFQNILAKLIYALTTNEFNETMKTLRVLCERKARCADKHLVAVNNGIFNQKTKVLEPFSPDRVFLSKSMVNYIPAATNLIIRNDKDGTDWDVESWMSSLHDNPEVVELLWQLIGASIRPNMRWNKCAFLYSETGNNGKGTLCTLIRNICGPGTHTSISIADFSKDFALEGLLGVSAVITDENDVGVYIDRVANLKACVTNDILWINRKFKAPIAYRYQGFMIQCLNGLPRIKDRSESFYRRQLFIPMNKCFTGAERAYIKHDYLAKAGVLEYVLHKVLHMDFDELSEPAECRNALNDYRQFNDPVRQFWSEMRDEFVWNLLPNTFLYDLYKAWHKRSNPAGQPVARNVFINDLAQILRNDPDWHWLDIRKKVRSNGRMDGYEPLIIRYELVDWYNPTARSGDPQKIANFPRAANYRGPERSGKEKISDDENNTQETNTTEGNDHAYE